MPVPESQVRDLLAAIRDALSPPEPASDDARQLRRELVEHRAAYITGTLKPTVEGGPMNLALDTRLIRELAARPLPYEPEGGES